MADFLKRWAVALALGVVLLLPAGARASVVYQFVLTAYTGTVPHDPALTDIRLTLTDAAVAAGAAVFEQDAGLDLGDPPTTVGSGVEQFSWWVGNRLPADATNFHFAASLTVLPDKSLTGDILFASLEDTLFLSYDSVADIWRGDAFSDRPPVCTIERTCSFEGYFALVPEPGTLTILAVALIALGAWRRQVHLRRDLSA